MGAYSKRYTKGEFNTFLVGNNVDNDIIHKFGKLPETITKNDIVYSLYINVIWYSIGDTFYKFELNYYSEDEFEFLFSFKVFDNIEISIDNLLIELKNI